MSRNNPSNADDFYQAMFNYSPGHSSSSSAPQMSNSPYTQQFAPTQPFNPMLTYQNDIQFQQYQQFQYQQFQQQLQQQQQQFGGQPPLPPQTETAPEPTPQTAFAPEPSRKGKGKKGSRNSQPIDNPIAKSNKPWSALEMKILTECWLDTSEDPFVGTSQPGATFWAKVREMYNAQVEEKRNANQLTSKWRKIRGNVAKFNAIWSKYDKDRASGENDTQVMEEARKAYYNETNSKFNMYDCWLLLKDKPLVLAPSGTDIMGRNKRKAGGVGSSVHVVDSDDDVSENEPVDLANDNEMFGPDQYRRPTKTKTPRTSASSDAGSSRSSASDLAQRLEKLGSSKQELIETQKESLAIIREEEKKRTMYTALSFMGTTELDEDEKKFLKSAKKKLMAEYKNFIQGSDDEN